MPDAPNTVIEFLILADRAEISGGKLYMMGGCWDRVQVPAIEPHASIGVGVAMRLLVSEEDGAAQHTIVLNVDGPGQPSVVPNQIQFVRNPEPADLPGPLPVLVALECFLAVQAAGLHTITASLDGVPGPKTQFQVVVPQPQTAA